MNQITLDGRQFEGAGQELTVIQDDYICAQLRKADAWPILLQWTKENAETSAQQLLTNILERGLVVPLLAGVLTEVGKHWTLEEAERNADRFRLVTDDAEKQAIRTWIISFVVDFFLFAQRSSVISLKSLFQLGGVRPTGSAARAS